MTERKALFCMWLASFLWGITFIFQRLATGALGALMFTGIRMLLGVACLFPFVYKELKKHLNDKEYIHTFIKASFECGFLVLISTLLQQYGLIYTTAGKAGFITSMYTVFVPVLSILSKKKVSAKMWIFVLVAVTGSFLISFNGLNAGISRGDLLVFFCSIGFAFQIMAVDKYSKLFNSLALCFGQFLVAGIVSLLLGLIFEKTNMQMIKGALIPILYSGIFSCAIGYTLQMVGQKYTTPTKATLVLSLESVWGLLAGLVFLGEALTFKEAVGCAMIFLSVLFSQLL